MAGLPASGKDPVQSPTGLVERLRAIHLRMVDAVLGGDGLEHVARMAAEAAGAPVVIVIPRLGAAAMAGGPAPLPLEAVLEDVRRYVGDRTADRPSKVPESLALEVPISSGDEVVGIVVLLNGTEPAAADAAEYLHLEIGRAHV